MSNIALLVTAQQAETSSIRSLVLARPDGRALPGWTPGSHIKITLPSGGTRSYSLINSSVAPNVNDAPTSYRLAVRLEDQGKGGSRYMHALRVGDVVQVAPPENRFALEPSREEVLLLAGGIGVTPLISMAAELRATGRPFRFVYAGRSADQLAFLSDVETLAGRELTIHTDDTSGLLDVDALVRSVTSENTIYVCGPLPLIDATLASAREAGLESRVKFELFAEQAPAEGDTGFEVVLAESGARILVHPDQTILQALTAAGEEVMFDCERGDCGMCQMQVIEGVPDHRDYYLSETERRSNKLIQVCVSRSKTPVLVLAAP